MGRISILLASALALAAAGASLAQDGATEAKSGRANEKTGAVAINSFDRLIDVLKAGGEVRAIFHYARCRLVQDGDTTDAPDAIGGMKIETFEYFAPNSVGNTQAFLSASQTSLIARRGKHVYNYVKLKLYQDGQAEITARYLEPPKMKVRMDETFLGRLNDGQNRGAVYLYQTVICQPCSCSRR